MMFFYVLQGLFDFPVTTSIDGVTLMKLRQPTPLSVRFPHSDVVTVVTGEGTHPDGAAGVSRYF